MMKGKRYRRNSAAVLLGTMFQLGWLGSCDDRLVGLTNFVDPCGTILANCVPGQFAALNADIGDFCVDPTCTVPGLCGLPTVGSIRDICP